MWRDNENPPQLAGRDGLTTEAAANIAAPEVSPAIRRGATRSSDEPCDICQYPDPEKHFFDCPRWVGMDP